MSRHIGNIVFFVFVLMTLGHVKGQTHDVAQLNRKLTIIKNSVDRDVVDIKLEIMELKTIVEQMVVDQRNASDGSIIGQGNTGVNQKEITDLKNKLKAHENRLNQLFSTVNEIQKENSARKRTANAETTCDEKFNALQKKFEDTAAVMMTGYKNLKTHMSDQINSLSQSVISEHNKVSARMDKADEKILILDGEANKLDGFSKAIEELKTKIGKCCTGQLPFSVNGYRVRPIFGSDLEKHIKIGTRVVRGAD